MLSALVESFAFRRPPSVITWSSPVPSFGDADTAWVASLGINPSNLEFIDSQGNELTGTARRFETLGSLQLHSWRDANEQHLSKILKSCRMYFSRNPYDAWFSPLDYLLSGVRASYYGPRGGACHLDLVPHATRAKWSEVESGDRSALLNKSSSVLGALLRNSKISVLILNGQTVVKRFSAYSDFSPRCQIKKDWNLERKTRPVVPGISYEGAVSEVGGVWLGRKILTLGYNHNLQSSFGVTNLVMGSIRHWIARTSLGQ